MSVPFRNICHQSLGELLQASKVADTQSFSLHNTEPLLHLVHPRAVNRGKLTMKAGMSSKPLLNLTTFVHLQVIEHQKDVGNARGELLVDQGKKGNEFDLSLSGSSQGIDLASAGVKGCEQV